jgi:hypothetical protein
MRKEGRKERRVAAAKALKGRKQDRLQKADRGWTLKPDKAAWWSRGATFPANGFVLSGALLLL